MDTLLQDVRFGARMLFRSRGSSAIAVLALALGIGLTAMMFSIVWGAMLRGLPFEDAHEIVSVARTNLEADMDRMGVSIHDFEEYRAQQRSFEDLAAFYTGTVNVTGEDQPERFDGAFMSAQAFGMLGATPLFGRLFTEADQQPGVERVMLLSYKTWQTHFGGSRDVLNRVVRANAEPTRIIGVMPEDFGFPSSDEVWLPLTLQSSAVARNEGIWLSVFGRLRDGVTIDQAGLEMAGIAQRLEAQYPETNDGIGSTVKPYITAFLGNEPVTLLYTMLGAVFMVLLIACANVANLLIARAAARSREVGIRTALGASKIRVVRQFLTETLLLSLAGATIGLGVAWVGTTLFNRAIVDTNPPFWIDIRLDGGVLLFVLAISALAAVLAGAIPALQAAGSKVAEVLKDESRGASSFRLGRISRALVVAEIALSAGLLVGAGLTIKSVTKLRTLEMPFSAERIFTARIGLPEAQYADAASQQLFWQQLEERLRQVPGTEATALLQSLPAVGSGSTRFAIEGAAYPRDNDYPLTRTILITPTALDVLEADVIEGRAFGEQDRAGAQPVAVINQRLARTFFPDGGAIGRRIRMGGAGSEEEWRTIIGIVPDLYPGDVGDDRQEAVYLPLAQGESRFMTAMVLSRGDEPLQHTQAVREAVQGLDPDLPIYFVQTLREAIDSNNWFYMVFGSLFMLFGAAALFLASVGLYGVMANSVSQRTREMGVRMALGATARDVLRLVMRQGLLQLAFGLVLGLALAVGVSNLLQVIMFEVNPRDPAIYVAIGIVLSATAMLACLVPATRATRVDPQHALRYD